MGGMHDPPGEILVTYSAGMRKATVERLRSNARTPYRVVPSFHGRVLAPTYHEREDDARYEAAKWVDRP